MLLVLLVAFAAQQSPRRCSARAGSGFFGMLVVTPLGYLIQLRFRGPPAMVTFLPSFWLLVPGRLGLLSVTRMLSDRAAGIDGLVTAVFVFTSIALGTLMGAALYKQLTERFGAWQLQLGRVGRYFRRDAKSNRRAFRATLRAALPRSSDGRPDRPAGKRRLRRRERALARPPHRRCRRAPAPLRR